MFAMSKMAWLLLSVAAATDTERIMRVEAKVDAFGEAQLSRRAHGQHVLAADQGIAQMHEFASEGHEVEEQAPEAPKEAPGTTLYPANPKGPLAIDDNAWTLLFKAKLGALFPVLILIMLAFSLLCLSSFTLLKAKKPEGEEAEELKAQEVGPEALEEDLYGLAIASIVRDSRSYCKGYSTAGLMLARMGVSVMILVLTLVLQVYLMASLKALVTSVAVNQIRTVYDQYEIIMYGNDTSRMARTANGFHRGRDPYFNPKNFELLDEEQKEQVCQIPLSQPTFFMTLLTIWTFTVVADMRKTFDMWIRVAKVTPTVESMKNSMEPVEGSEEMVIVGLTMPVKVALSVVLFLPRFLVDAYLLWLGCRWLTATPSFEDVILNAVALEFILVLNNVVFSTVVPLQSIVDTRNTQLQPQHKELQPTARSVLAAFSWGIASMGWVLLYMYLLQAVLPQYRWDVRDVCIEFLESKTVGGPFDPRWKPS
ncbi:unnamed protein product [Effrenium voratum]|nr:unnamed protein product [Effrenium voratum]